MTFSINIKAEGVVSQPLGYYREFIQGL